MNDEPPPPLSYVQGTTTVDGTPQPDVAGQSPLAQGLARSGLNIGTVEPGRTVTFTYQAIANQPDRRPRDADPEGTALQPRGRRAAPRQRSPARRARRPGGRGRSHPRRDRGRRADVRRPPARLAARRRHHRRPAGPGVRLRPRLPAPPSVDPDRVRRPRGRHRHPQRRGRPRPRHGARLRDHHRPAGRRAAARRPCRRRGRPRPGHPALRQPQVERARGLPVRADLGDRQPVDLRDVDPPRLPGGHRAGGIGPQDLPGPGARRPGGPLAAALGPRPGAAPDRSGSPTP